MEDQAHLRQHPGHEFLQPLASGGPDQLLVEALVGVRHLRDVPGGQRRTGVDDDRGQRLDVQVRAPQHRCGLDDAPHAVDFLHAAGARGGDKDPAVGDAGDDQLVVQHGKGLAQGVARDPQRGGQRLLGELGPGQQLALGDARAQHRCHPLAGVRVGGTLGEGQRRKYGVHQHLSNLV